MSGLTKRVRGTHAPQVTSGADAFGGGRTIEPGPPLSADRLESIVRVLTDGVERGLGATTPGEGDR